jgi:hypothetical protein
MEYKIPNNLTIYTAVSHTRLIHPEAIEITCRICGLRRCTDVVIHGIISRSREVAVSILDDARGPEILWN